MKNRNVMLISPVDVKAESTVNFNVSDEILGATIRNVQNVYLEEIIGTHLLERYQQIIFNTISKKDDNIESPENEVYADLYYGYIKPFCVAKTVVEVITPLLFKLRNVGLTKNTDTNVETASLSEMRHNLYYYETMAATYATRLSKTMGSVKDEIMELDECNHDGDMKPQINKDFVNNGIWLGGNDNKCKC